MSLFSNMGAAGFGAQKINRGTGLATFVKSGRNAETATEAAFILEVERFVWIEEQFKSKMPASIVEFRVKEVLAGGDAAQNAVGTKVAYFNSVEVGRSGALTQKGEYAAQRINSILWVLMGGESAGPAEEVVTDAIRELAHGQYEPDEDEDNGDGQVIIGEDTYPNDGTLFTGHLVRCTVRSRQDKDGSYKFPGIYFDPIV